METKAIQVCNELIDTIGNLKSHLAKFAEPHGLTTTQLFAMYKLYRHGDLAMSAMAIALHCDASNVTGIVDRLVGQELIERQEKKGDRRTKVVHLTDKGRILVEDVVSKLPGGMGLDSLTEAEQLTLHKLLSGLKKIEAEAFCRI